MSNELAIKELKSLLRFKQGIANLEKPNNAMSEHTIDKAKEEVISLQSTIDTLSGVDISDDKIREIFLRNSKVREFELKDGAKVGYRVTGIEEGEKAVKEISELISVQQEKVITERPLIPFNIREIKLLIDQLQRFEGVLGKYNCQYGGLKCNFQTNCHRLLRAEINKLELLKEEKRTE